MLKVTLSLEADDQGVMQEQSCQVIDADGSHYSDELAALSAAANLMQKMDLDQLCVIYGHGRVLLKQGDDLFKKADELFYRSSCFDLSRISLTGPELKLGEPDQAGNITEAARSALRIARRFDKKVSFIFNCISVPTVEQKGEITQRDIKAVEESYFRAFHNR